MSKQLHSKRKKIGKGFFLAFATVFSLVLLIGSTYAWLTYSDERVNQFDSPDGKLKINLEGQHSPIGISPNLIAKRDVKVRNESSNTVFIRVSIEELLLTYEIDTTDKSGNGHLKDYASSSPSATIEKDDPSTWVVGAYYQDTVKNRFYKGITRTTYPYVQGETARPADLKNLELAFSSSVLTAKPNPGDPVEHQYWLYYDGYFYYSEKVYSTNETSILLESISLKEEAPNRLTGSFYNQNIKAEGILLNSQVFDVWGIPKNSSNPIYNMLQEQLH